MTQLIKDKNNKYIYSTNDVDFDYYEENLQDVKIIDDMNNSVVYLPVHNIKDIYEWYRIFQNSYLYTDISERYGFAIHGYFDKSRGESIKGWFPNLVEVKASSSDKIKYFNDGTDYFRSSIDFIDVFNGLETLFIDHVEIYENEKVLLKNQYYETLSLFLVDNTYTEGNTIYINTVSGDEDYFFIGNVLIMKTLDGSFIENKITNLSFINISSNDYIVVTVRDNIDALELVSIADIISGDYAMNTLETQNGVYEYVDGELSLCEFMTDKYKVYNQIVYTYQGESNENKEFYLRRQETKFHPRYTLFPVSGINQPMIYSEGSAYLVKCNLSYNTTTNEGTLLVPSCCACQDTDTSIAHPSGPGPHDLTTDPFRLLYTDYTQASKLFLSGETGPAKYLFDSNVMFGMCTQNYVFYAYDEDGNTNAIQRYFDLLFNATPYTIDNISFNYVNYVNGETLEPTFENSPFVYTQLTDTTLINHEYLVSQDVFPDLVTIEDGTLANIKIVDNERNIVLLDMTFQVADVVATSTELTFEVFPKLDENLFNDISGLTDYTTTINFLSLYGSESGDILDNIEGLKNKINKTILGRIYNFSFSSNELKLINIKPNNPYIYENPRFILNVIDSGTEVYKLNHSLGSDITIYDKEYTIEKFLSEYLDVDTTTYNTQQTQDFTFTRSSIMDDNYFEVGGSVKLPGRGNRIYFGKAWKEKIFDIVGNRDSYLYLDFLDLVSDNMFYVWVNDLVYDEEKKIGYIDLLEHIPILGVGHELTIESTDNIQDYSRMFKYIFRRDVAGKITPDDGELYTRIDLQQTEASLSPYKIDTAKPAFSILNAKFITPKISAVYFKQFNEPRISFTKRDKFFKFEDDQIINVKVCSIANVDITTAPASLNGYVLANDDLILIRNQTNNTENGVYIYDGVGNALIRYENINQNIYWYTEFGTNLSNTYFTAYYTFPLVFDTTPIIFIESQYKRKSDPRLTLTPVAIAKLGVDNKTQPFKKINKKFDLAETEENLVTIQIGINNINNIKFINGLTEYNILNDIDGQGQYAWILNDSVITENAIVGCTNEFGSGTGKLIWYTGTWVQGNWCDGIWVQGIWKSGVWYNGIFNANDIQNNNTFILYSPIQNNVLSTWESGVWLNGTWNGGIALSIQWFNGIFNGGIIYNGIWQTGTFNGGVIKHIHWKDGLFTGGDFETGVWEKGTLDQLNPNNPARFGINSKVTFDFNKRAIWRSGIFRGGEFYSEIDKFNSSVFYSGLFENAFWYGGSFISGVFKNSTWEDGVWFGGYKCTIQDTTNTNEKLITINPEQYDSVLGLVGTNYMPNIAHNLHLENSAYYFLARTNNIAFANDAFINMCALNTTSTYTTKPYVLGSATNLELKVNLSGTVTGTTYEAEDLVNNVPDGNPFISAEFTGNWKKGIWLNGVFVSCTFENGVFSQGHVINGIFGTI